jgi:hypothetical protein
MLKHRSNVQGNEENSNRKPVFNKSVSIKRLSESINIASQASIVEVGNKHGNGDEFPDLLFFLGIINVKVGSNILGSIGNTQINFFWPWF